MMETVDAAKVYDDALKKWGISSEIDICIEEMAELIQALIKYKESIGDNENYEKLMIEKVAEEHADVLIMLEQMSRYFNGRTLKLFDYVRWYSEKIYENRIKKLKRVEERLKQ